MKMVIVLIIGLTTLVACEEYDYKFEEPYNSLIPECDYFDPLFQDGKDTGDNPFLFERRCYGWSNSNYLLFYAAYDTASSKDAMDKLNKFANRYEVRVDSPPWLKSFQNFNDKIKGDADVPIGPTNFSLISGLGYCADQDYPALKYAKAFIIDKWFVEMYLMDCNKTFEDYYEDTYPSYCEFINKHDYNIRNNNFYDCTSPLDP